MRTQPGQRLWTNRDAARWSVLLERRYGPPKAEGDDWVWEIVPGFFDVRVTTDAENPIRARRQLSLPAQVWERLQKWPPGRVGHGGMGTVMVSGPSLDFCASAFKYLEEMRGGGVPSLSRLSRRARGRDLPGWYQRLV
jgi:hypothetical protein